MVNCDELLMEKEIDFDNDITYFKINKQVISIIKL